MIPRVRSFGFPAVSLYVFPCWVTATEFLEDFGQGIESAAGCGWCIPAKPSWLSDRFMIKGHIKFGMLSFHGTHTHTRTLACFLIF